MLYAVIGRYHLNIEEKIFEIEIEWTKMNV